jgi:hypothetical protein
MKNALRLVLIALCALVMVRPSSAAVIVSVTFAPPALPVYELPVCPGDGYLWTPGYWAYDADYGYYWIPGTWVLAPEAGFLWTPAWWGWEGGAFIFHDGFWGPTIGFYGGINYGFGYFGVGFAGGRWDGGVFRYNTAVLNVNTTIIHNTYIDRTVIVNNTTVNRVSYNGGNGGTTARPTPEEERAAQERHIPPVAAQQQQVQAARSNPDMRASRNEGKPPIAATSKPGEFSGRDVVAAREAGAPYPPPANAGNRGEPAAEGAAGHEGAPAHASDIQPHQVTPPNTGNPKLDQKYEKQEQKLVDKQNKEHADLEKKQAAEHAKATKNKVSQVQQQQMEQKHQQQTQQMEQRHDEQMHDLQSRQPAPRPR